MTRAEFHTGIGDPIEFACRLLRKAYHRGSRVLVTAPPPRLAELDRALWMAPEREFVPHVRMPGAPAHVASRTPIWLAPQAAVPGAPPVVINLGADAPADLSAIERLIEVVSDDPDEAAAGRQRWRLYRAGGLEVHHHGAG